MTRPIRHLPVLALAALLAACAAPGPKSPEQGSLLPNENLLVQGIPDIPVTLVRQIERYTDFRGHGFVDWHPQREEMLVAHRGAGANTVQLYRVTSAMATPERLTDFADTVSVASYEPREGRYIVFARSTGGNEADQLYRLDLTTRAVTLLTDPDERHAMVDWLRQGSQLLYTSVPLDRTAAGGTRANPSTTLWQIDPARPTERRKVAELPGTGWSGGGVSPDDRTLALTRFRSANESQVWLLDLASGQLTQRLPAPGETVRATHLPVGFTADGRGLFVISDRASEFRELMRFDLQADVASAAANPRRITGAIPWDATSAKISRDGAFIAVKMNIDGREELRLFDGNTLTERSLAGLPPASVNGAEFHPRTQRLALSIDSAKTPGQVHVLDLGVARSQPWTQPFVPAGIDTASFQEQRIVRWKSFDGLPLSGVLNMPPARFTGKRPVIVRVHGGPEAQATTGFIGGWNYLVNELGVAIVQPNVRGSAGYGKTFLAMDNGFKREDSVKDLGSLLDWIAAQPDLDASRVIVYGGSYGGYMSLAASVHFADRIAGAIDVVGISNFVTFLNNTESYRRDLRRVEYGDERDPAMREFLERISPLNNASRITKPLFVVQGKNDPRVPYTEAEQIVDRVRSNGGVVWYLRAENEGHGFRRKENADFQFYAMVRFLQQTVLK